MHIVSKSAPTSIILPFPQGWQIDDYVVQFFPAGEFNQEHWRIHHPNGDWLNLFRDDKNPRHFEDPVPDEILAARNAE